MKLEALRPGTEVKGVLPSGPEVGDLVHVNSRRWLVEAVVPFTIPNQSPVMRLAYADEDVPSSAGEASFGGGNLDCEWLDLATEDVTKGCRTYVPSPDEQNVQSYYLR